MDAYAEWLKAVGSAAPAAGSWYTAPAGPATQPQPPPQPPPPQQQQAASYPSLPYPYYSAATVVQPATYAYAPYAAQAGGPAAGGPVGVNGVYHGGTYASYSAPRTGGTYYTVPPVAPSKAATSTAAAPPPPPPPPSKPSYNAVPPPPPPSPPKPQGPPSKKDWPEPLKDYVTRSIAQARGAADETFVQEALNKLLSQVYASGRFLSHPWATEKTPIEKRTEEQERELQRLQEMKTASAKAKALAQQSRASPSKAAAKIKRKAEQAVAQLEESGASEERFERRNKRFQKEGVRSFLGSKSSEFVIDDEGWTAEAIVGTSTVLEKRYFRLTSAPKPEDVRPLPILKQTLELLKSKWSRDGDYTYICDQFKSMRQDLTVQHLRNDFTAKVYEAHARIALEKGDLGEFNQCQTQLKILYDDGIPGSRNEFTAYRLLYFLLARDRADINKMLAELAPEDKAAPEVAHALQVRAAIAAGDYRRVCDLYVKAPAMGAYVMDHYIERERVLGLCAICKAYRPDLLVQYIEKQMQLGSPEAALQFLESCGAVFTDTSKTTLDTKQSLVAVLTKASAYTKVDIRGQL